MQHPRDALEHLLVPLVQVLEAGHYGYTKNNKGQTDIIQNAYYHIQNAFYHYTKTNCYRLHFFCCKIITNLITKAGSENELPLLKRLVYRWRDSLNSYNTQYNRYSNSIHNKITRQQSGRVVSTKSKRKETFHLPPRMRERLNREISGNQLAIGIK